jgi:hypothetical protein
VIDRIRSARLKPFHTMSRAKSLRAIGQTLQTARVTTFKLEKHADLYRLWIANRLFCFGPADISRLDAQARKRRANHPSANRPSTALPQQLRALGCHLDRIEVRAFRIVWTGGSALLEYERVTGERNHRVFAAEELRQVGLHRSLLRSSHDLFPRLDTRLTPGNHRNKPGKAKYGSASSAASDKLKARPLRFRKHV